MATAAGVAWGSRKHPQSERREQFQLMNDLIHEPVVSVTNVSQHYGKAIALDAVNLDIPAQKMIGLIGPDGVGKSTLLGMIAGVRKIQAGKVLVLGGDIASADFRTAVSSRVA